jgi:hypothetical protein
LFRAAVIKKIVKGGVYAITMGIIHGNNTEYGFRFRHLVAYDDLDTAVVRFLYLRRTKLSDYGDFHCCLDFAVLFLAEDL